MCTTCGCGAGEARVAGKALSEKEDTRAEGSVHAPPERPSGGKAGVAAAAMSYSAVGGGTGHSHPHAGGKPHRHAHHTLSLIHI